VPAAGWEHFAHDADIGVMGHGATPAEAFEQAALALTAIVTDAPVAATTRVDVACGGGDLGLLLVDWLDAVIYAMAVRKMLFGRFRVEIDGHSLRGTLWGEPVDVVRHAPGAEPKGATLTALKVERQPDGSWSAGCVVDV
jgi:tRNA nucleotidyltransferase (CCA-adding enzyme)